MAIQDSTRASLAPKSPVAGVLSSNPNVEKFAAERQKLREAAAKARSTDPLRWDQLVRDEEEDELDECLRVSGNSTNAGARFAQAMCQALENTVEAGHNFSGMAFDIEKYLAAAALDPDTDIMYGFAMGLAVYLNPAPEGARTWGDTFGDIDPIEELVDAKICDPDPGTPERDAGSDGSEAELRKDPTPKWLADVLERFEDPVKESRMLEPHVLKLTIVKGFQELVDRDQTTGDALVAAARLVSGTASEDAVEAILTMAAAYNVTSGNMLYQLAGQVMVLMEGKS